MHAPQGDGANDPDLATTKKNGNAPTTVPGSETSDLNQTPIAREITTNATKPASIHTPRSTSAKTVLPRNPLHNPVTASAQWAAVRRNQNAAKGMKR